MTEQLLPKPNTNRIEAFSDGVLAILITLMVLEIKLPHIPEGAARATNETKQSRGFHL
jgi:uncharacterized membrane protein